MKDDKVAAYLRVLPPKKPEKGISTAKMMGLLEERYGDLVEFDQEGSIEYGDRISALVRGADGILDCYIFPDVLFVGIIEPTNYFYAFRFILWIRKVFPPEQRLIVYNEYILEQITELTAATTEADLAEVFGTAAI